MDGVVVFCKDALAKCIVHGRMLNLMARHCKDRPRFGLNHDRA